MARRVAHATTPPGITVSEHGTARVSLAGALFRTARPKQWVKNVLVLAAPAAAGVLDQRHELLLTMVTFAAFCLAASGIYFFNDAFDAEADRLHPTKRKRPVAAGELSVPAAKITGTILIFAAIAMCAPIAHGKVAAIVAGYVGLNVAYSVWLKHEAVIDLGAVTAGFVLRAIAGAAATNVPLSDWFLIVAAAGSLFMVTGKRHAEQLELGTASGAHRTTLAHYSTSFLGYVRAVSSGIAITAYCIWAFEAASTTGDVTWFRLSIVPFVLAIFRYALLVEQGHGGAPEEIVLADRVLQVLGLMWVALFAIGVYV